MKFYYIWSLIILATMTSFMHITLAGSKALTIEVKTEQDSPIKKELLALAKEMERIAEIYQTTNQKAYWENEGKKSFYKLLHSKGYYSSTIDVEITNNKTNSIIFHINNWQRYTIDNITIKHTNDSNKNIIIPTTDSLKIKAGQFAIAENILGAQKKLFEYIENNNCLLSLNISHEATINHLDNKVDIIFLIDAGPTATIEKVEFTGLKEVNPEYVRKLVGIKNGQCFRNSYITKSRNLLQKSGLFASTSPDIPTKTNKTGSVPVIFKLTERKARSFKAGIGYGTDLGLGVTLGWEHRNFFGNGEEIDINLFAKQKEQLLELNYSEPFYKRDDQTLKLGIELENKTSKAFDNKEVSVSAFLERKLSETWTGGFGTRFSQSKIKTKGRKTQHFSLLSTPLFLVNDTRDNILDPSKGYELKIEGAPYFSIRSKEKPFFKTQISGSTYFALTTKSRTIIAVHAATGNILGIKSAKIPHTERFYVGGSNSLRGYAYQLAGELDKNKRPLRGRSFLETSLELRLRLTDNIEVVGFIDSGLAYSNIIPLSEQKLLHGAGFGFRYITDFGPIRADIGFPLKRRKFIDDAFQLYFGIGQAF